MSAPRASGRVLLVGAGPGAPDLITVRGAEALRRADVVVHDALVSPELLELAPSEALRINVGKRGHDPPTRSQEEIHALLVRHARDGRTVVRLKGGDPFVFGRGGEEASACAAAGVPCEVIPGVTSAFAAPALAGIPITDRRHAASAAIVTGHRDATRPWTSVRWDQLATGVDTLVILMGMRNLEKIASTLIEHGRAPETPCAIVTEASAPRQRVLEAPLGELARRAREAKLGAPAVIVVGGVTTLRRELGEGSAADRPLAGWRVLVTRPPERAQELARLLREAGAEPVVMPAIRILPQPEGPELRAVAERLDAYHVLAFTSANAARAFGAWLRGRGRDPARWRGRVACVGAATARAAREEGFPSPAVPAGVKDARSLAAALAREEPLAGRRVLFPTAKRGRDTLPRALRAAGAEVDAVAVYHTAAAELDRDALRGALERGELDALTFFSPSAACAFAGALDGPAREAAGRCVVAAVGEETARLLRRAGMRPNVVAVEPGARALVAALAGLAGRDSEEVR